VSLPIEVVIIADCASPLDRLAALLDVLGERALVQLRDKHASGAALYERATAIVQLGARLLVNDRLDVALAAGAAGVHLPEDGLDLATARALGAKLVGCSRHTPAAAAAAEAAGADLVILGPIFPTPSKPGVAPLGVQALTAARAAMTGRARLCAIGGIDDAARAAEARAAGATAIAAIRAWWGPLDVALALAATRR